MDWRSRITIDPEVRFGKPCIKGTRITVGDILQWLGTGMSVEEITSEFPQVTRDDISAALLFASQRETMIIDVPA